MFEVNGVSYTLKYNQKKLETIETVAKTSVLGEISKGNGFLPYNVLKYLFSLALIEENTNSVVKQKEAAEMFEKIIEENGLATVNTVIVEKLQEDLGFLFR
ncbi:segregation and condensation protein B [Oceanobacillus arenosus]|uniref:Segregation and condensation protein B n=1 Tax=Oceanobacillus arenosus TaxID=1229153 RepID=A0A3D8PP63_9BACI|nr:segregation and condensation protein B [Oceanobacillus arenosus]RDW17049.1 segregation and condensation protein B [Oceanobacillus arenosus]